jgi:hypothetical protein
MMDEMSWAKQNARNSATDGRSIESAGISGTTLADVGRSRKRSLTHEEERVRTRDEDEGLQDPGDL